MWRAQAAPDDGLVQQVPTRLHRFKRSLINSDMSGWWGIDRDEPSAANSGGRVVETSNWNIAYTPNGGAATVAWKNQNPYAISSGYCCDTQVVYDKDRDVFILMLLDYAGEGASTNGLRYRSRKACSQQLPVRAGATYKFTGAQFGERVD